MGTTSSKVMIADEKHRKKVFQKEIQLQTKLDIPFDVQVAHYTPSTFPIVPVVTSNTIQICKETWKKLISIDVVNHYDQTTMSGMTAFYNDFYDKLAILDNNGKFEAVLSRHANGQNKISLKGNIIMRVMEFVLNIDPNDKNTKVELALLGKSHSQKAIRPWQYSVFIQILLATIASQLGTEASNTVMEAWVNLFSYTLQYMLPEAIKGKTLTTEIQVNTSMHEEERIARQVQEIVKLKKIQRNLRSGLHSSVLSTRTSFIVNGIINIETKLDAIS